MNPREKTQWIVQVNEGNRWFDLWIDLTTYDNFKEAEEWTATGFRKPLRIVKQTTQIVLETRGGK